MKNQLTKLLAMGLSLVMALSLAACSKTTVENTSESASKPTSESKQESVTASETATESASTEKDIRAYEGTTLRIAVAKHPSDSIEDFNQKYAIKEACEATGINVEWVPVIENSAQAETVGVMLAGDLPDVFLGLMTDSMVIANSSLFVPLEDMIEEYAPNVYATYTESFDGWENFLTFPDGHIYGLAAGYLTNLNNTVRGTMWINQTWLDNLGLEMPTDLAAMEDVLVAFRDQDADGDGDKGNEIPLDFCQRHYASKYYELAHCFGLPFDNNAPSFYDTVDGQVEPIVDSEAFREFLEYFNYLVDEGLANIDGATQTSEQYNANLGNGLVGAFWGWSPSTYITDAELQAQYVPVPALSAEGYTFRVQPDMVTAKRTGYVVTTACENVEAALALWDYMSRDQVAAIEGRNGQEGLMWEMKDGVAYDRVYTAEEAKAFGYDALSSNAGNATFTASMGLTNCAPLILNAPSPVDGTSNGTRAQAVKGYVDYFTEPMSEAIIPADAKEEFDFTTEGFREYVDGFAVDAILNGVTDDSWNTYVSGLKQYNHDFYIEYYQKYLDGTLE